MYMNVCSCSQSPKASSGAVTASDSGDGSTNERFCLLTSCYAFLSHHLIDLL